MEPPAATPPPRSFQNLRIGTRIVSSQPPSSTLAPSPAGTVTCCLSPPPLSPADLNKHRRYEIRMSVYNAVGEGPLSPPHEVFVGEAGERGRPFPPPQSPAPGGTGSRGPSPPQPTSPCSPEPGGAAPLTTPHAPPSAHGSTPQRGCPRCHGHAAGRDLGASPAGKPEWRHPGLQGTGSTGPQGQAGRRAQGSPGLPPPPWLFAHRPQQYRGAGAKLLLSAVSEGRLSSDARHSGLAWLVSLPGGHGPHPGPPDPHASVGPCRAAVRPTPGTILVLTGCPISKGPLIRLGNLHSKIISNFGVMSHVLQQKSVCP